MVTIGIVIVLELLFIGLILTDAVMQLRRIGK